MADYDASPPPVLTASNLAIERGGRLILRQVSLELRRGDLVTIVGPNGSGKSTLLLALTRRLSLRSGGISFSGPLKTGWANQLPRSFPNATVLEHALGPRYVAERTGAGWSAKEKEARAVLESLQFSAIADHRCGTLSTGELRVAELTRALLHGTELLFLDEPTAGLYSRASQRLAECLLTRAAAGCAIVIVTHDREWEQTVSRRRLRLSGGTLIDVH